MNVIAEFDEKGCYSYKKITSVTLPILLSMLMEHIIGMTDTAFLGRVDEVALGASALGTVYFLAFFVLGTGFSFGAQILIARRNGEKNFRKTGQIRPHPLLKIPLTTKANPLSQLLPLKVQQQR